MKLNIVHGYGLHDVRQLNSIIGTYKYPKLNNQINEFIDNGVNVFIADYTPVQQGNILIKYPNQVWKKLRLNSKIVKTILANITFVKPHCSTKSNILASIHRSRIITIEDERI